MANDDDEEDASNDVDNILRIVAIIMCNDSMKCVLRWWMRFKDTKDEYDDEAGNGNDCKDDDEYCKANFWC